MKIEININNKLIYIPYYDNLHNGSFSFYITKDFLTGKIGNFILNNIKLIQDKYKKITLYCDFIDDKELIEKFESIFYLKDNKNIKFTEIKSNNNKIVSFVFIAIIQTFLKNTDIFKELVKKINNINGVYYNYYYYSTNEDILKYIIDDLYEDYFKDRELIIINNTDSFNFEEEIPFYGAVYSYDGKEILNTKDTFLGLFFDFLNNKNFNKTYKDIKNNIYNSYIEQLYYIIYDKTNSFDLNIYKKFLNKIGLNSNFVENVIYNYDTIYDSYNNSDFIIKDVNKKHINDFIKNYITSENKKQIAYLLSVSYYYGYNDDYYNFDNVYFGIEYNLFNKYKDEVIDNINTYFYIKYDKYILFDILKKHNFIKYDNIIIPNNNCDLNFIDKYNQKNNIIFYKIKYIPKIVKQLMNIKNNNLLIFFIINNNKNKRYKNEYKGS